MFRFFGKLTVFSMVFFVFSIFAFSAVPGDDAWLPVSPEELAAKTPKIEPDADAEALFWEIRIDDSSEHELSMKHYVRVKILPKEDAKNTANSIFLM